MSYTKSGIGYQKTDTSFAAATINVDQKLTLKAQVLEALRQSSRPLDTEELAGALKRPYAGVQPRLSELRNEGKVADSGDRGYTQWGRKCIRWTIA